MRVGYGYDVHRLASGHALILGGVTIPSEHGLVGHSDADVLVHAIMDALLGAATLGDIGTHFPDTDPEWADANSLTLLQRVARRVYAEGYRLANVDATVVLERPKLQPHIDEMRRNIGTALEVELDQVSVKATTAEGLGPVGEEKGSAARAVCLLHSDPSSSQ
ncbi:MAG: 2-C-methyl-D-erythritol 2,4-cyclodiphosphate synthase [Salinibacter sp.]